MRVVRIFLSTPSDVDLERVELANLVREINDTIQFLAPEQEIRLELVHYETHAFPDVGAPQDVIDRQIPIDFEIYLGIMWKRAGTPTGGHPSGTMHEFHQALRHRSEHGWPTIMFFFCDEAIEMPSDVDELDQLREVVKFRDELSKIGYTVRYPRRTEFREVVRGRLLRALADVIEHPERVGARAAEVDAIDPEAEEQLESLAARYDHIRETMSSGPPRTREMTRTFSELVALAPRIRPKLQELKGSSSAGHRLAAIAILHAFPDRSELEWLAERLDNPATEAPFIGYQAASALGQAVRSLPDRDTDALRGSLERALDLAYRLPGDHDRIQLLDYAMRDLETKHRAT